jgi:hypothetical protein
VWSFRKNKPVPAYYPPSSVPASHRRTIPATPPLAAWISEDADWLELSADADEAKADALLQRAARKRALSDAYRTLIVASVPRPVPQPLPVEPQIPAEPDPSQHNPTWQLPQEPGMCGCRHGLGESCELCDAPVSEGLSILTPWSPAAGDTVTYPEMVNGGWQR